MILQMLRRVAQTYATIADIVQTADELYGVHDDARDAFIEQEAERYLEEEEVLEMQRFEDLFPEFKELTARESADKIWEI